MSKARILVVRGGAIGDFIMTLPALAALRERWPDAHIEILGYPHITELARDRYYAQATRSIEAQALSGFFVPDNILEPNLADYFAGFHVVISYLFDPDNVFADNVRRCGVRQLIEASPRPTELHAAVHYCKPLEALAIYVDALEPRVYPNDADRAFGEQFLGDARAQRLVAVHPGSGSEKKNWPAERFAAVCRWLADEYAVHLLVVKGEADTVAVARLTELLAPRPMRIAHGLRLPELAAVLERCALFLGNDSGITHLAAAAGTPTIAFFGTMSMPIWQPRGRQVRVVQFGLPRSERGEDDVARARVAIEELLDRVNG